MRHVASLLWLLAATVCGFAPAAATSPAMDRADLVRALAREHLGPQARIAYGHERILDVDLQGRAVAAAAIGALLTRLALEDVDRDLILLRAIRIANGRATGRLLLQDLVVPFALSFSGITLDAGLTLDNVDFAHEVDLDRVTSQRKLFIDRSWFQQGLSIVGGSTLMAGDEDSALHINKTRIERDLLISNLQSAGIVEFYDNQVEPALRIEDAEFREAVKIRDNDLADLLVYRSKFDDVLSIYSNEIDRLELKDQTDIAGLVVSQNKIENMTDISDVALSGPQVEFALNTLERELYFAPETIASGLGSITLVGNTVQGLATVVVPRSRMDPMASPLALDVGSSTFNGLLKVRLGGDAMVPPTSPEDYCYRSDAPRRVLSVDLTAVQAARFAWNMPVGDCRYVWNGRGFRYQQWVSRDAGQSRVGDLLEWRRQISDAQPSALLYMSEHLRSQGRFTDSRNIIFEAKRMDYEPSATCAPRRNFLTSEFWDPNTCAVQELRYGFLYTSGFGVKPEYGLYFLGVIWAAGMVVYYPYSWMMARMSQRPRRIATVARWLGRLRPPAATALPSSGGLVASPGLAEPEHEFQARRPPEGFALYQKEQEPKDLSLWVFSLDAALPVVNLHAYDVYFPTASPVRAVSYLQHGFGWWIATSLLTSVALL